MSWEAEVSEISKRRGLAKAQGGAESIDRQHNQGKLTIRERIDSFLDADSFREHGKMAGGAHLDEFGAVESFAPANYVLGLGTVNGKRVAVGGEDFTLKGGSPNAAGPPSTPDSSGMRYSGPHSLRSALTGRASSR